MNISSMVRGSLMPKYSQYHTTNIWHGLWNIFRKYYWTPRKEKARQEQEAIDQAEAERILREEIIKNNTEIVSAHTAAQNAFHESHAGDNPKIIKEVIFRNIHGENQRSFWESPLL